ncbi:MAG: arylesterase [Deltaproteobacteria bacterium]|nr:arylesterase [Deltaproteobacteria bacterium]
MGRYYALFTFLFLLTACGGGGGNSESPAPVDEPVTQIGRKVIFYGDSLTSGYHLGRPEAYPAVVQQRIDAEQLPFTVVNAGQTAETTGDGWNRLKTQDLSDTALFFLALGANDGLRQINPETTRVHLQAIIDEVRSRCGGCVIVMSGMRPIFPKPTSFEEAFVKIFPEVAAANGLPFYPFLLDGIFRDDRYFISDGIHPTPEGQRIMGNRVADFLLPILREYSNSSGS